MQTQLIARLKSEADKQEAEAVLRSCVHCGFCNATCPTYQIEGNELDGPRGRIYLIKQMLEGQEVTEKTRRHLDRCLSCRACETTCPSGVNYHRLLDLAREYMAVHAPRSMWQRGKRKLLARALLHRGLFRLLFVVAVRVRSVLPRRVRQYVPPRREHLAADWSLPNVLPQSEKPLLLVLNGCVQDTLAPDINRATNMLMSLFGWQVFSEPAAVCCGAVQYHLDAFEAARAQMRRNIDLWWPHIRAGRVDAIVVNASGCGAFAKDYAHMLRDDDAYSDKAARVAGLIRDPVELLVDQDWPKMLAAQGLQAPLSRETLVFHPPCSLQHGQGISARKVESLLQHLGAQLKPLSDAHLCCGAAGTYVFTQPALSRALKREKQGHLRASGASRVVTANIGCQAHLATGGGLEVLHWLEWVAEVLTAARSADPEA